MPLLFYTNLPCFVFRSWHCHTIRCFEINCNVLQEIHFFTIIILLRYVGTVSFDDSSAGTAGISPTATGNNTEKREVLSSGSGTNNFMAKLVSDSV